MIYTDTQLSRTEPRSPTTTAQKHGVVYTRPWAVELILNLCGYSPDVDLGARRAIEPAAGDGSFLLPMAHRLIESARLHGHPLRDLGPSLTAHEIDAASAARARASVRSLLLTVGASPGEASQLSAEWVRTGDYLLDAGDRPAADFVVGNPPYIRLEEMDPASARRYRERYPTMVGRADLYVAFFEAALKHLAPNGVCGFICADRWMLNQYGAELRRLVTSSFAVETVIELHRANAFADEVSAYPAITIIRRARQAKALVARADPGVETGGAASIHETLDRARTHSVTLTENGLRAAAIDGWFAGAEPWPCCSPGRLALLRRLEANFYPLESAGTGTKVSIGVATGADDVFITTDPALVEDDRLLPLALAADTITGALAWSGHYLVNPWNDRGLVDLEKHPRLAQHFRRHEATLRGRHVGKKNQDAWHRTIDRVDPRLTGKAKLYIPDIKDRLNPVLDRGETYPHHNLYYIQSAVWDPEVLGGLLLSDVAQLFVEAYGVRMRGGYLRFQAQYLRRIRVPLPQEIASHDAQALRRAFQSRDRAAATHVALRLYGIDQLPQEAE